MPFLIAKTGNLFFFFFFYEGEGKSEKEVKGERGIENEGKSRGKKNISIYFENNLL